MTVDRLPPWPLIACLPRRGDGGPSIRPDMQATNGGAGIDRDGAEVREPGDLIDRDVAPLGAAMLPQQDCNARGRRPGRSVTLRTRPSMARPVAPPRRPAPRPSQVAPRPDSPRPLTSLRSTRPWRRSHAAYFVGHRADGLSSCR